MILVVGSTGSLGGRITRGLLERGRDVRILVRDDLAAAPLVAAGARRIAGDLRNRSSLDAACQGIDTVVTTAISLGRGADDTVEAIDLVGNRNLVEAAAAAGVRHFVFTSVLGAAPDHPLPFFAAKARTEEALLASGMTWTILAPDAFMDVWLAAVVAGPALSGGEVVYVGSGERRHMFVHSRDVAAFAIASVDNPAAAQRRLEIGGPEAISLRDAVATFERVLGWAIPQRGVAPGGEIPGMSPFMAGMLTMLDSYESVFRTADLAREFDVSPTSVEAWATSLVPAEVG